MRALAPALFLLAAQVASAQMAGIESCDGSGRKTYLGPLSPPGGRSLSILGRVVDTEGSPVCGAWVSVRYVGKESHDAGPASPTGKNGEFVLQNLAKGATVAIEINPFHEAEWHALHPKAAGDPGVPQSLLGLRRAGLRRYRAAETVPETEEGVIERTFVLESDPLATEVVRGHVAGAEAGVTIIGELVGAVDHLIGIHFNSRTGDFVAFGVPPGAYMLNLRRTKGQSSATASTSISVRSGNRNPDLLLTDLGWK